MGFLIEVFNVFGVGDGFFLGLLKGWFDGEDWLIVFKYVNVCGVFVVSCYGCIFVYLLLEELEFFLNCGVVCLDLWNDLELE